MDNASLFRALSFAAEKHRHQRRKDVAASPYINHPIAVATVLAIEAGLDDPTLLMGAILHDTVEDTETNFEELSFHFGTEVADLVRELTDDKSLPKDIRKRLQVAHAPHRSQKAKCLKMADKICNIRDITEHPPNGWSKERRLAYLDWAHRVVNGCRDADPTLSLLFDEVHQQALKIIS
ncbi:MAG: bifunctional (p)ppGpp synthetase/guanosine-3',5'-bis(diphosphate) 3'-pyrophosphohydrolase [Bacteroidetes Order II. Incertae sedis bacterium]|nr:bifunctional (p)ppGpp synthetase/guanosine-3',5'-bis(diphosphate) 3'-pyrophosphohydrolase [Bacteroidetes Order II. bacterium]